MGRTGRTTLLVFVALLGYQLLAPPIVGLANNGDFPKILGLFNLGAPAADEFAYAPTTYTFDPKYHWRSRFYSSELLLVGAAVGLNTLFSKTPAFDLRWMGAVHAGLFVLAVGLVLPLLRPMGRRGRLLLSATLVLLFTDAMYATVLNSFYMDAGALVFLALAVAFYLRERQWGRRWDAAGMTIACVLLVTAKTQHALLAVPIAALLIWEFSRSRRKWLALSATAILAAAAFGWRAVPSFYAPVNLYDIIFLKVLPASKDPARDLRALGLDESYRQYAGTFAYWSDSPMQDPAFVQQFGQRTGYARLGWFFLVHPARAWRVLREALSEGGRIRPPMGNFDRSAGLPPLTETRAFAWWSGLKRRAFEGRGSRYVFFVLFLGAALLMVARQKAAAGALVAMALLEMCTAGLGDAVDHARHFFLFHALTDMLLAATVACAVARARRFVPKFRDRHARLVSGSTPL